MLNEIKTFLESQGWLANLIEIATFLLIVYLFLRNKISIFFEVKKIKDYGTFISYVNQEIGSHEDLLKKIKEKATIVIIDDELEDIPIDYLKKIGFNPDSYEKVSLSDAAKFSKYDVVFLDIAGVVEEDLINGGLELIKRIKHESSSPAVIAVSSNKFDPTKHEFFKLADETLNKPITEQVCEEALIEILKETKSPCYAAEAIDALLYSSNLNSSDKSRIMKESILYIKNRMAKKTYIKKVTQYFVELDSGTLLTQIQKIKDWVENDC